MAGPAAFGCRGGGQFLYWQASLSTSKLASGAGMSALELCENCGRQIGRLEQAHSWDDHVVCAACKHVLSLQSQMAAGPAAARTACDAPAASPTAAYVGGHHGKHHKRSPVARSGPASRAGGGTRTAGGGRGAAGSGRCLQHAKGAGRCSRRTSSCGDGGADGNPRVCPSCLLACRRRAQSRAGAAAAARDARPRAVPGGDRGRAGSHGRRGVGCDLPARAHVRRPAATSRCRRERRSLRPPRNGDPAGQARAAHRPSARFRPRPPPPRLLPPRKPQCHHRRLGAPRSSLRKAPRLRPARAGAGSRPDRHDPHQAAIRGGTDRHAGAGDGDPATRSRRDAPPNA